MDKQIEINYSLNVGFINKGLIWYIFRLWDMVFDLTDVSSVSPSSEQTEGLWGNLFKFK